MLWDWCPDVENVKQIVYHRGKIGSSIHSCQNQHNLAVKHIPKGSQHRLTNIRAASLNLILFCSDLMYLIEFNGCMKSFGIPSNILNTVRTYSLQCQHLCLVLGMHVYWIDFLSVAKHGEFHLQVKKRAERMCA